MIRNLTFSSHHLEQACKIVVIYMNIPILKGLHLDSYPATSSLNTRCDLIKIKIHIRSTRSVQVKMKSSKQHGDDHFQFRVPKLHTETHVCSLAKEHCVSGQALLTVETLGIVELAFRYEREVGWKDGFIMMCMLGVRGYRFSGWNGIIFVTELLRTVSAGQA